MSDQTKERAGQTADAAQKAMATGTEAAQGIANAGMVAAEQFTKRIAELSLTAFPDVGALTASQQRNMEALSASLSRRRRGHTGGGTTE